MELFRALAAVVEPPGPATGRLLTLLEIDGTARSSAHADLFAFQLFPYASVYLGGEGMLGGEARDRIAGFWRAIGQTPPAEPDHLSVLLALYARVSELAENAEGPQARAAWGRARAALLWEHLLSWLPAYLAKLDTLADEPYRTWGRLTVRALDAEARRIPLPAALPLHLREAPPFGPAAGREELLEQLLAPVRTGTILTRTDLGRAARFMGTGLRAGERRYALGALLDQHPGATLAWLAGEAERARQRHAETIDHEGIATFWISRAREAARALQALTLEGAAHA